MTRTLHSFVWLITCAALCACSGQQAHPDRHAPTLVSASHSIYLEGGVLKVFADDAQNILYLYVRPAQLDHWVTAGGGGGGRANPWQHETSLFWALADESGRVRRDSPRKSFTCLFDSQQMTLTMETGTYAVRRGDFVVVTLDENWRPDLINSGIDSLRVFDLPETARQRLISHARKHYRQTAQESL